MKIYYEPTVYLLHVPCIYRPGLNRFLGDHNVPDWETTAKTDGDAIPEIAGRLCYLSFEKPRPGGNSAYLDNIKQQRHGSVIEHPSWGFIFAGISRTCTHELVRHRLASYSQLSQRYVDESVCEVVCPLDLKKEVQTDEEACAWMQGYAETSHDTNDGIERAYYAAHPGVDKAVLEAGRAWRWSMQQANEAYRKQVGYLSKKVQTEAYEGYLKTITGGGRPPTQDEWLLVRSREEKTGFRKQARQAARSVLPNATETKIYTTMNARAFRHMIEMRASRHAEPEIRQLAYKVWQVLKVEAPAIFSDYVETPLPDGTVELTTANRKV